MNSFLNRFINKKNIHLDFAATTPVDFSVYKAMKPFFSKDFFNPSSSYKDAISIKKSISKFRTNISRFFQVKENEVFFTQGGTESNNIAIIGLAKHVLQNNEFIPHMIFSSIEHPAISECIPVLKKMGVDIDIVPVSEKGIVQTKVLEKLINERTILISIILVSNELGVIQPIHKISSVVKKYKNKIHRTFSQYPFVHTDASQAVITENLNTSVLGVDMISIDGSKMYAPKMSGLLIKKQFIKLSPVLYGGGQEGGLRSGTEHAASIAGLSKALDIIEFRKVKDIEKFNTLKKLFIQELDASCLSYTINGDIENSAPHILNICIQGLNSDFAIIQLDELGINCSAMTACASSKGIPKSDVIIALGRPECAQSSLRFSFGRTTTPREIKKAVKALVDVCKKQKVV
jgi:cysteine desulfurase